MTAVFKPEDYELEKLKITELTNIKTYYAKVEGDQVKIYTVAPITVPAVAVTTSLFDMIDDDVVKNYVLGTGDTPNDAVPFYVITGQLDDLNDYKVSDNLYFLPSLTPEKIEAKIVKNETILEKERLDDIHKFMIYNNSSDEAQFQNKNINISSEEARLNSPYPQNNYIESEVNKARQTLAKIESDRIASEKLEKERSAKIEADRISAEKIKQERLVKIESDRIAAEKAEQERLAKIESDRIAAEKAEEQRLAKIESDRIAAEKAEQERLAKIEVDRLAAEKADLIEKTKIQEPLNYDKEKISDFLGSTSLSTSFTSKIFPNESKGVDKNKIPILQSERKGIINPGNNCYLNALLQMLYDISFFREQILQSNIQSEFIEENKELLERYYMLKMFNSMFILKDTMDSKIYEEISNNNRLTEQQKNDLYYKAFTEHEKNIAAENKTDTYKMEILQSLYSSNSSSSSSNSSSSSSNSSSSSSYRDLEARFIEDNDATDDLIQIELNELKQNKMNVHYFLIYLFKIYFENIKGDKTNLTFEPLLLPLILFGNFGQQEAAEALETIDVMLDETYFKDIEHTATSTKYFTDSKTDFNNIKGSLPENRVLSKQTFNQKIFNLNLEEAVQVNIQTLITKQEQPKLNMGSLVNKSDNITGKELQRYNDNYTQNIVKQNEKKEDFFNSFTIDTRENFKEYILFYLVRELVDSKVNTTPVTLTTITIKGQSYDPIGVIVRTGNNAAGHFYYIDIKNKKKYNDSYVSDCENCFDKEVLSYWRMALYKKSSKKGGSRKFRASRRKQIKKAPSI